MITVLETHRPGQPTTKHSTRSAGRRVLIAAAPVFVTTIALCAALATGASAAGCPNEQLREENSSTQLPDCRAFEQVTPPYKQGSQPYRGQSVVSAGGDAVAFKSQGSFAGSGQNALGNNYLAQRGAQGWTTTPTGPPADEYEGGGGRDSSADLTQQLLELRKPTQSSDAADFYLRKADGTFSEIGPSIPTTSELSPPGEIGGSSGGNTEYLGASADLSHVIFTTFTGNTYFPGEELSYPNRAIYEYVGTENTAPQLVNVDNAGASFGGCGYAGLGTANGPSISRDGRRIFFGLEACESSPEAPYARIDGTTTVSLAGSQCTRTAGDPGGACNAPASSTLVGAVTDGSTAYFTTTQQLVNGDIDEGQDIYACALPAGAIAPHGAVNPCPSLEPVSVTGTPGGANVLGVLDISENGNRIAFIATGVLSGTGTNAAGASPVEGAENLYVFNRVAAAQRVQFVGDLCSGSGMSGSVALAQCPSAPGASDEIPSAEMTPPDGRFLVFSTFARLEPGDSDEAQDVYRYDSESGSLLRVSIGHDGYSENGNATEANAAVPRTFGDPYSFRNYGDFRPDAAVSDGGNRIFFTTNEALVPLDTNGQADVYEWENGQVNLISDGVDPFGSELIGASTSGDDVFFTTVDQLTWQTGDTVQNIYDARVDGGFAAPASVKLCAGEACQGPPSSPAALTAPGSTTLTGLGNAVPGPSASAAKLRITNVNKTGSTSVVLKISAPTKGRLIIAGPGLKRAEMTVRAGGTVSVRLTLTASGRAALRKRALMKVKVKVLLEPGGGEPSLTTTTMLTFKEPGHTPKLGKSGSTARKDHS